MSILDSKIYKIDVENKDIVETTIRALGGGEDFWETETSKDCYRTHEEAAERFLNDFFVLDCCG
jgi:hypothetical protein